MQCWLAHFFLYRTLLRRYVSTKVEPSFVGDIKLAAGFGGVGQYVGRLTFMYKVKSKIRFDVLLGGGGWVYEKCGTDVFCSKIDLQVALNKSTTCKTYSSSFSKDDNIFLIFLGTGDGWFYIYYVLVVLDIRQLLLRCNVLGCLFGLLLV